MWRIILQASCFSMCQVWWRNRLEQLNNPHNISDRYKFPNSQYYSHNLNGITQFVLPFSVEGKLILFITSYQHLDIYYQYADYYKKQSKEYKDYLKMRGFDWD